MTKLNQDNVLCTWCISMIRTVPSSVFLVYPEHCVYSETMCYCPNLYRPNKWYAYARNCIGPCYFRQNLYIQRYIFDEKCIFKTKGLTILSAHRAQIFTECTTPIGG